MSMSPSSGSQSPSTRRSLSAQRLAYLDGLRACAAIWVLLDHTFVFTLGTTLTSPGLAGFIVHYGHLAVDLFIVLSGYCLMLPVAARGNLGGTALWFYGRRSRRILPTYYAALALAMAPAVLHHIAKDGALPPWRTVGLNLLLLQDWFAGANVFDSPTWSVAVEWKIYFLFPVLVWAWQRWGASAALGLSAVVGGGITLLDHVYGIFDHWSCPWYVLLFGTGVAVCALRERLTTRGWAILSTFGALGVLLILNTPLGSYWWARAALDTAAGLCAAAAIVWLHDLSSQGLLTWHPLVRLGTFSYSLYLTHVPIILMLMSLAAHEPHLWRVRGIPQSFALFEVGLTVGLAYVFFLCFERPFLTTRRRETSAELARDAALSPAP